MACIYFICYSNIETWKICERSFVWSQNTQLSCWINRVNIDMQYLPFNILHFNKKTEVRDPNIFKKNTQTKTNRNEKPNSPLGKTTRCKTFRSIPFSYYTLWERSTVKCFNGIFLQLNNEEAMVDNYWCRVLR